MTKKRMRYQWFQDVPRNVTRQEYQRLQFYSFAALGLGGMAVMMAIAAVSGLTLQDARELDAVDHLTIAEAANHTGDRLDLVKLEGFLVTDSPLTMPDDEGREVIRGELTITARAGTDSETEDELPKEIVLYDWAVAAESVYLTDGDHRLPLAFNLAVLPMQAEPGPIAPETIRTDESPRTSRPLAIQFGEETFPLPLDAWGPVDRVSTDMSRLVLPQGQSAIVVAAVEATPEGAQLTDPLGDRLQVYLGTEDEIVETGQRLRVTYGIGAVILAIVSFFIARSAYQLRQEFLLRSNQ
jgi:hypothetical protein